VKEEVYGINRTDEDEEVATARVHIMLSDRSIREIGKDALDYCSNLVKVTAPLVEKVGKDAFEGAYNLRHVTLSPDVVVTPGVFIFCLSLEVLAASVGFELDTGDDKAYSTWNDPTVGITRLRSGAPRWTRTRSTTRARW